MEITRTEAIELRRRRLGITKKALAQEAELHPVYAEALINGRETSDPGLTKLEAALARLEAPSLAA